MALLALVVLGSAAAVLYVAVTTPPEAPLPRSAASPWPVQGQPVDTALARAGGDLFERVCAACHTIGGGHRVGPDLAGLLARRDPAWIRGMVLAPDSMTRADPVARELLRAYSLPMPDTNLSERELRAVVEYVRAAGAGAIRP